MTDHLTPWEQRRLAIIHDMAIVLSSSEWDALRWHFEQVWDDGYTHADNGGSEEDNPYNLES